MKDLGEDQRQGSLSPREVRFSQVQGGMGCGLYVVTSDPGNGTERALIQLAAHTKLGGVASGSKS